jgi:ubiquinone/menaquinone biosynthesis C-methylase UbiE/pimeloyl-ACP methyl ester carboxylesterase
MSSAMPDSISRETFDHLHPEAITDRDQIEKLLEGWKKSSVPLRRGTNRAIELELATLVDIRDNYAVLNCVDFGTVGGFLFLSTEFQGVPYFCNAKVREAGDKRGPKRRVKIFKPGVIYRAERRDRARRNPQPQSQWVKLVRRNGHRLEARVLDRSGDGLGIILPATENLTPGEGLHVEDRTAEASRWAVVRSQREAESAPGWRRIGLSVTPTPRGPSLPAEPASTVLEKLGGLAAGSNALLLPEIPNVVHFRDHQGESMVGLLDRFGPSEGAPAILVPSAWGKTKETLSGLSATLLATFAERKRAVSVLRFDGIRKRGESHNDPECQEPSLGNLNYTFTQGATDLLAAARFLQNECGAGPIIIVSFSVASVEARRAIAIDHNKRFSGWVSVVGATDPQSLIRVISGGVDYLAGAERGIRFGRQDVQGMLLDIDRTADEALSSKIAFLEDARRDFASIRCPLTWITGSHDAWMDPRKIEDMLSFGSNTKRRLITSNTGHQLRSSREATEIFGIVASECARMFEGGDPVQPVAPDPKSLRKRQVAERRRLRQPHKMPDLRPFWRDYLVGRDASLGMELVTETSSYRSLMLEQIGMLDLKDGQSIIDLGSGVATFERALHETPLDLPSLNIIAIDYVFEGLLRGRRSLPLTSTLNVGHVVADLDLSSSSDSIPLARKCADRVVVSLLLNYLLNPDRFLAEVFSLLRPTGRIVLSALRRDADTSKICVDGVNELRTGQGLASFGVAREKDIDRALGGFINDAARLLDLEEQGIFRFWDENELEVAVRKAGFIEIDTVSEFGDPPQAWVVTAIRPT